MEKGGRRLTKVAGAVLGALLILVEGAASFSLPCSRARTSSPASLKSVSIKQSGSEVRADQDVKESTKARPLHQNWYPVATVDSLKDDRPNQVEVLGKPLVTYYDKSSNQWKVLDDMCSHRFAPLSEGRVVDGSRLQCAYHGWEFSCEGTCTNVPQQPDRVDKAKSVQAYAVREDLGLLWVWMDPETVDSLGASIHLPINPLLRKCFNANPTMCFMRDLPYGQEILGENLLDLSHLPFAHHSVGQLKRSLGNELPTRMLSSEERKDFAQWELDYDPDAKPVLPSAQAEIMQAAAHDPILSGSYDPKKPELYANWTTHIGFFDPCHVRYRRFRGTTSTVELFMCPTSEGRSRVFLFNCFDGMITEPKTIKEKLMRVVIKFVLGGSRGHMFAHQIFDGDGIFLHKQGNRMKVADLSFRDYSTPASADILLNSYRRFLDAAATKTREAGLESFADAVVGTKSYGDDAPRRELLDRYNTHTSKCSVCMKSLQKARRQESRLQGLQTALQGATGSGIAALATLTAIRRLSSVVVPQALFGYVAMASAAGFAGSFLTSSMKRSTEKTINGFLFEDYIHAEKN